MGKYIFLVEKTLIVCFNCYFIVHCTEGANTFFSLDVDGVLYILHYNKKKKSKPFLSFFILEINLQAHVHLFWAAAYADATCASLRSRAELWYLSLVDCFLRVNSVLMSSLTEGRNSTEPETPLLGLRAFLKTHLKTQHLLYSSTEEHEVLVYILCFSLPWISAVTSASRDWILTRGGVVLFHSQPCGTIGWSHLKADCVRECLSMPYSEQWYCRPETCTQKKTPVLTPVFIINVLALIQLHAKLLVPSDKLVYVLYFKKRGLQ